MGNLQLIVGSPSTGLRQEAPVEQLATLLAQPDTLLWLDMCEPGAADLALLRQTFGFHELALEDAARRHQRPKCDLYDSYYFVVVYAATTEDSSLTTDELQMFWGANYLVTLHQRPLAVIDEARRRWVAGAGHLPGSGVAYFVYTLLDSLVDVCMQVQDEIVERAQALEERIFPRPAPGVLEELFQLRKDILRLRRLLGPTRDVLNEIVRRDLPVYPEMLRPYFQDVYDHVLRVLEGLDTYRDVLAAALDAYLSAVSNQLNQTVKRMTALTLIVMVPTLIAGIYGMNFQPLVPPGDAPGGFWFAVVLMAACIAVGVMVFRRVDWL